MANEKLDLISRSALIAEYDRIHVGEPGKARKLMEDAPTVDAAPVVYGRWEEHPRMTGYLRCSKCHDANIWEDWLKDGKWNYCPNCGSKMDGGNDDGSCNSV